MFDLIIKEPNSFINLRINLSSDTDGHFEAKG